MRKILELLGSDVLIIFWNEAVLKIYFGYIICSLEKGND